MSDVSRETPAAPPAPLAAQGVFGDRLDLAERYAALLASDGVVRGLIGPREVDRLWDRHLLNCALLATQVPADANVADVGSGAGLPGLVLALARPDLTVALIEPLLRRVTFLDEAIDALGLTNVAVLRGRAEELHTRVELAPGFDVVTARAVAPLARLLDWCLPLVAPHGSMIAMKGSQVSTEVADARGVLDRWGCTAPVVVELGADAIEVPTFAVQVAWAKPEAVVWPARPLGAGRRPGRRRR